MKLEILMTSNHQSHTIDWCELSTVTGDIVIQPGHAPTVVRLKPDSTVRYLLAHHESPSNITISAGIAHITRTSITIIATQSL